MGINIAAALLQAVVCVYTHIHTHALIYVDLRVTTTVHLVQLASSFSGRQQSRHL